MANHSAPKRRRFTKPAIMVGVAGSLAIALGMGASLSGYVAQIVNNTNTAATAALAIQETQVTPTGNTTSCNSYDTTASCGTINKYGGTGTPLVPGGSQTTTVSFKNAGTVNATTATLAPSACVATSTGATGSQTPSATNTDPSNLCSVLTVAVYAGSTATGAALYNGTAANFTATITLTPLLANASQAYTFVVTLPSGATTAVQGQQVKQPLTWTFNQ